MAFFTSSNPVFDMLKKDHAKVKSLFEQFEETKDSRTKERIIKETLNELDVHAKLEETLIYPAIRAQIDDEDIMDEALEEHHVAHTLMNELKRMSPGDDRYKAKFTVLGESIKHHIKEEEDHMFPEAEKVDVDWEKLGQKAMERKEALLANKNTGAQQPTNKKKGKATSGLRSRARNVKKAA